MLQSSFLHWGRDTGRSAGSLLSRYHTVRGWWRYLRPLRLRSPEYSLTQHTHLLSTSTSLHSTLSIREGERKLLDHSPVGPTHITRYQVLMEFWNLICIASILGFWYLQLLRRSFPDVQLCYDLVSNPTFVRFPLIQPDRPDWPKLGIKLLSLLIDPNEVPNWQ